MVTKTDVMAFMGSAKKSSASHSGNSDEAVRLASAFRGVVRRASEQAPRSQQTHLGPSELGVECDRQVVAKLVGLPRTNHVGDPWPSVVGTAVHAWLEDAFSQDDPVRWLTERRVAPVDEHPGTADLYDENTRTVIDHKVLGVTTHNELRTEGPSRQYFVQLMLYALGYFRAGYAVDAIAIAAWPRTKSTINGLYVWHHPITQDDWALVRTVLDQTKERKTMADLVGRGLLDIMEIPHTPSRMCFFCPIYRPEAATDGGYGCPGQNRVRV